MSNTASKIELTCLTSDWEGEEPGTKCVGAVKLGAIVVVVGDVVKLRPGGNEDPYLLLVTRLFNKDNTYFIEGRWFFRRDEIKNPPPNRVENEVFLGVMVSCFENSKISTPLFLLAWPKK